MSEYIEKEALRQFPIRKDHYDKENGDEHFIFPAADVTPIHHGRWIDVREKRLFRGHYFLCSNCKSRNGSMISFNYCPNCGAKMDLEG